MTVLLLSLKLMIYIGLGCFLRKIKVIRDGFDKAMTRFVMALPLPCMIANSFISLDYSTKDLLSFPLIIGLSFVTLGMSFLLAQIVYVRMGKTGVAKSARYGLMFTNFTFFGFAVVSELYGPQATLNYVLFTLPIRIFFYGAAPMLLGGGNQRMSAKDVLKKFISEPVVAVVIGFIIYVTRIQLPTMVTDIVTTFGNMASPLGLILCGIIIADANWSGITKYPSVFVVTALRLAVVPGVILGLYLLIGVDKDMIRSVIFYSAMPVATFLPTFGLQYAPNDLDERVSGGYMVIISTLICVFTVPFWAYILELI